MSNPVPEDEKLIPTSLALNKIDKRMVEAILKETGETTKNSMLRRLIVEEYWRVMALKAEAQDANA